MWQQWPAKQNVCNLLAPHAKAQPCTNITPLRWWNGIGLSQDQVSNFCSLPFSWRWLMTKALQPACEPHRSKTGQHHPIHMHRGIPIRAFCPHTEITAQTPTNDIIWELPRIPNHIAHNSKTFTKYRETWPNPQARGSPVTVFYLHSKITALTPTNDIILRIATNTNPHHKKTSQNLTKDRETDTKAHCLNSGKDRVIWLMEEDRSSYVAHLEDWEGAAMMPLLHLVLSPSWTIPRT